LQKSKRNKRYLLQFLSIVYKGGIFADDRHENAARDISAGRICEQTTSKTASLYPYAPIPKTSKIISTLFSIKKPDADRLAPTPEAIKRITSDMKEVLLSKNRDL
jgi:hypothetical protein